MNLATRMWSVPSGISAAGVFGLAAGALAWIASLGWLALISGYVRLDQVTMMTLGAVVGVGALGGDALRRRGRLVEAGAMGALYGGIAALVSATIFAQLGARGPSAFVAARIGGWAVTAALVAAALFRALAHTYGASWRGPSFRAVISIAFGGGLVSGVCCQLSGPFPFWQAIAFVWFGVVVCVAVTQPMILGAIAVVELVPPRDALATMWSLREWPLAEGDVLSVDTGKVYCVQGRIALYPPAGGATLNGRAVSRARYLNGNGVVGVGRHRFQVTLIRRTT